MNRTSQKEKTQTQLKFDNKKAARGLLFIVIEDV